MSRLYKDLSINEKINAKSWGFWRLPNPAGFVMTMIVNANSFHRQDYADFMRHHMVAEYERNMPRANREQKKHMIYV